MNLSGEFSNRLQSISFNQDSSGFACGNKNGYCIYNCDPFGKNNYFADGGVVVELLYNSSLIALVGGGVKPAFSPRRLKLWNIKEDTCLCELDFPTAIVSVKLNRKRLVLALENDVRIYDLQSMKNLQTLQSKGCKSGLLSLCANEKLSYIALPASNVVGDVLLYDALNLNVLNVINAHKNPCKIINFNPDGNLLATASVTGTIVRVFHVPSGNKLYSFRRGTYTATIYSLSFNAANTLLACSSSSKSIHVFKLNNPQQSAYIHQSESVQLEQLGDNKMTSLLPETLSSFVESTRSFTIAKLPSEKEDKEVVSICAIHDGLLRIITSENEFYQYCIGPGECQLLKKIDL